MRVDYHGNAETARNSSKDTARKVAVSLGLGGRRSVVSFGVHIYNYIAWIPTLKRDSTSHWEIVNIEQAREFANLPRLVTRGRALGFTKQGRVEPAVERGANADRFSHLEFIHLPLVSPTRNLAQLCLRHDGADQDPQRQRRTRARQCNGTAQGNTMQSSSRGETRGSMDHPENARPLVNWFSTICFGGPRQPTPTNAC